MKNYEARSYQKECLKKLRQARKDGVDRALISMASGLGKTVTAALDVKEFQKEHPDSRVLVLCHQVDILDQIRQTFFNVFGEEYSYGMYNGEEKAEDTEFLFANLQSVRLHKEDFYPDDFAYIIVDEAHHSPARTYRESIEYFEPDFLLGMTATPERTDNADITEIFGEIVFFYSLEDAIYDGWLSDVDYRMKLDEIQRMQYLIDKGKRFSLKQLNREIFIPKRDEEIIEIIRDETKNLDNPTMVIFCQTIAHADEIAEKLGAVVIHSRISINEREKRLENFRSGEINTVCAVDVLNEGIDVPSTDVIVFLRVTQSKIVFQQQLGRGLRLSEGKSKVLVLDFVATAERLELLFGIEKEFKIAVEKRQKKSDAEEKEHFDLSVDSKFFESRRIDILKMIKEARECSAKFTERYTNEELLQKLREFAKKLGRIPRGRDINGDPSMPGMATYFTHFGGLYKALEAAGLEPDYKPGYTDEELLQLLVELTDRLGRTPTQEDVKKEPKMPHYGTYRERFGSFNEALEVAGLKVNHRVRYSREELLQCLIELAEELGRTPKRKDLKENPNMPSGTAYSSCFGNFNNALKAAGFDINSHGSYDEKELLALLKEFVKKLGRVPKTTDLDNDPNMPSSRTYLDHFGGFYKALEAAGVKTDRKPEYTEEELINLLVKFAEELGRAPKRREVNENPNMPHSDTYAQRFGNFNNAIAKAKLNVNRKSYTDEELLQFLKSFAVKLGRTPTLRDIKADPGMPDALVYQKRFGKYNNAVKLIGLEPNKR